MAVVHLPSGLSTREIAVRPIDNSNIARPPLGGASQRVARLGSRYAVDVNPPPLTEVAARAWLAPIARSRAEGVPVSLLLPFKQPVTFGSLVVNGVGQAGTSLIVDGGTASATVPASYFFNVLIGGRNQLYMTTSAAVLSGAGAGVLTVSPMLRGSPADNAALNFAPVIEGWLDGTATPWMLGEARMVRLSLSIEEVE